MDSGISYGIYTAIDPFGNTGNTFAIAAGITTLEAIDTRHQQSFRYYESGYPFEYYMVRFFYHRKREIESGTAASRRITGTGKIAEKSDRVVD